MLDVSSMEWSCGKKNLVFIWFFLAYTPKIASQVPEENVNVGTWKFELGTSRVAPSLYLGCILSDIYSL